MADELALCITDAIDKWHKGDEEHEGHPDATAQEVLWALERIRYLLTEALIEREKDEKSKPS